jgi:MOSC domain-containing protein YiiM
VSRAEIIETGLTGDRHSRANGRAVTLIQSEHLHVIATLVGQDALDPEILRRNIVVSGINLTALRQVPLRLGMAIVEIGKPCAPCSRMEAALGPGGYNAMRGHGGWTARVLQPGSVAVGDSVVPDP